MLRPGTPAKGSDEGGRGSESVVQTVNSYYMYMYVVYVYMVFDYLYLVVYGCACK